MKKDIRAYTYEELQEEVKMLGEKAFRAKQIYEWLHQKQADSFDEMTNLSKNLRTKLEKEYEILRQSRWNGRNPRWTKRISFCSVCMTEMWWKAY